MRAAAREVESGVVRPRRRLLTALGLALLLVALGGVGVWRVAPEWRLWPARTAGEAATTAPAATEVMPASGSPSTATTPAPAAEPPPPPAVSLAQVLADPAVPTDTDTAFVGLFARWGLSYAQFEGASGCERAQQAGLRCLFESGTWNNLRQINRPAIIELVDDAGTRHHVPRRAARAGARDPGVSRAADRVSAGRGGRRVVRQDLEVIEHPGASAVLPFIGAAVLLQSRKVS